MNVAVQNIESGKHTSLPGVTRIGLARGVALRLAGIWDDPNGIVINLFGPFVVSCDTPHRDAAYQYLVIKEPNELR